MSSTIRPLLRAAAAVRRQGRQLDRRRDRLARYYDGLLNRFPALPLPGRGGIWPVRVRGFDDPFFVRQGSKDWSALHGVLCKGEYRFVLDRLPGRPRRIVDLGANIGLTTRLWLHSFPGAHVVAVEPDPETMAMCRRNVEAFSGEGSVRFLECCAAAEPGARFLERRADHTMHRTLTAPRPGTLEVPAKTLAEILEEVPGGVVDLLKCDVEGAERELFGGGAPALSRVRALAIELHEGYTTEALTADLATGGLEPDVLFHRQTPMGMELALIDLFPGGGP
jgi:FkbM family methyltransferase